MWIEAHNSRIADLHSKTVPKCDFDRLEIAVLSALTVRSTVWIDRHLLPTVRINRVYRLFRAA